MSVRAKMYVQSVTVTGFVDKDGTGPVGQGRPIGEVKLGAVSRGEENKSWSQYTPSAQVSLSTLNPDAFDWYLSRVKREVYVTFTDADETP